MTSSNENNFRVTSPLWRVSIGHKGQWRRTLIFSLICAWTNGWANNRDAGELRSYRSLWRHCNFPRIKSQYHAKRFHVMTPPRICVLASSGHTANRGMLCVPRICLMSVALNIRRSRKTQSIGNHWLTLLDKIRAQLNLSQTVLCVSTKFLWKW